MIVLHLHSRLAGVILPAILAFLFFLSPGHVLAQENNISTVRVSLNVTDRPLEEVLTQLESRIPYKFAYGTELIARQNRVTLAVSNIPLSDLLALLLNNRGLAYDVIGSQIVLRKATAPGKITISGYVKDAETGELLIGASILIPALNTGTASNGYGFYSLTVAPSDTSDLEISYVGYKTIYKRVTANASISIPFELQHNQQREKINTLVVASDRREENVKKNQAAAIDISSDMIVSSPSVNGAGDVVNSVEMLPGVQSGLEGTPGYCVRGGNTGQNLVLLDEATLYNPSHVFGLVSIFNAPAVKNVTFMKGGFPAAYGDEVSSILDIALKDGSKQSTGGVAQLGTISSGITLYGPLKEGSSSYLVAARRSTVDWMLRPYFPDNYFSNYYFYDVNAKMNFQVSPRDRLFFSFYTGRDNNDYVTDSTDGPGIHYEMNFGNTAASFRWNHVYSRKLFSNTSLVFNHYHQFLTATQQDYFAELYSGIRDLNAKMDFSYYPSPNHKVTAGINYLYQTLFPASVSDKLSADTLGIDPNNIPEKNAMRTALYASDDIRLGQRFKLYLGVRAPMYYRPDVQYMDIEPRLSLLHLLSNSASIKLSYSRVHQYLHLAQSYNASFPAEIWMGSSPLVKPQVCNEFSAGVYKNFRENSFQTSIEFYYKQLDNQLLFKGGTTGTIDNSLEQQLIFGRGWNYGAEFLLRKNRGRLTGWLAYTYAHAYQQFDSLNMGNAFPFMYDRRHTLYLSAAYTINKHWKLSANFLMTSGRAFTLKGSDSTGSSPGANPLFDDEEYLNGNPAPSTNFSENNYRLRPMNRLDAAISYKTGVNRTRKGLETEWILSVYNAYGRKNTSFVYRTIDPVSKTAVAREVSFFPVIPSLTFIARF